MNIKMNSMLLVVVCSFVFSVYLQADSNVSNVKAADKKLKEVCKYYNSEAKDSKKAILKKASEAFKNLYNQFKAGELGVSCYVRERNELVAKYNAELTGEVRDSARDCISNTAVGLHGGANGILENYSMGSSSSFNYGTGGTLEKTNDSLSKVVDQFSKILSKMSKDTKTTTRYPEHNYSSTQKSVSVTVPPLFVPQCISDTNHFLGADAEYFKSTSDTTSSHLSALWFRGSDPSSTVTASTVVVYPNPNDSLPAAGSCVTLTVAPLAGGNGAWTVELPISGSGNLGNYEVTVINENGQSFYDSVSFDSKYASSVDKDVKKAAKSELITEVKDSDSQVGSQLDTLSKESDSTFKAAVNGYEPQSISSTLVGVGVDIAEIQNKYQYQANSAASNLQKSASQILTTNNISADSPFDANGKGVIGKFNSNLIKRNAKFHKKLKKNAQKLAKTVLKNDQGVSFSFPYFYRIIKAAPRYNGSNSKSSLTNFHISNIVAWADSKGGTVGYIRINGGGCDISASGLKVNLYDLNGKFLKTVTGSVGNDYLGLWSGGFDNLAPGYYKLQAVQGTSKSNMLVVIIPGGN